VQTHGVIFCEHLIRHYPLTDRAIYTGYGTIPIANKSGQLDGTPYLLKPESGQAPGGGEMDVEEYVQWIRERLEREYLLWTLRRAGGVLPARLAECASAIAEEWEKPIGSDWRRAVRALGTLVELTITLAWAQTVGLARAARIEIPSHKFNTARDKLDALSKLWQQLAGSRIAGPFGKAFGPVSRSSKADGAPGREALGKLLGFRNEDAHGSVAEPHRKDLEDHKPQILWLIDALSLWAERPLISGLRYHPGERGRVQFRRHAGRPPERWDDMIDEFERLPQADEHVHVLWERDGKAFLADLYPFILLRRNDQRRFEPFVLREYTRDQAIYWSLHGTDSQKIRLSEAPEIHDMLRPLLPEAGSGA